MLIYLKPNNKQLQVVPEPHDEPKFFTRIQNLCSYTEEGLKYCRAYLDGKWDGVVRLMTKTGTTNIGLLSMIETFLKTKNIAYRIIDERQLKPPSTPIDISARLQELNRPPRWYQQQAVDAMCAADRGIIKAATGSGKTQIAAMATAKFGAKTAILVIGTDLLHGFHSDFSKIFNHPIGIIGDGKCDIQDISIVSIWTVGSAIKEVEKQFLAAKGVKGKTKSYLPKADLSEEEGEVEKFDKKNSNKIIDWLTSVDVCMIDECHITSCNTISKIYDYIHPQKMFGFSGTPQSMKGSDLITKSVLGDNLIEISASTLIKEGVLAKPIIKFRQVPACAVDGNTYMEEYSQYVVTNPVRNAMILRDAKELVSKGYQTLILFSVISHGKILKELFEADGTLRVEILDGHDSAERRNEVKRKALAKEVDVILASKIFNIGVDIPSLSGYINAAAGKSYVSCVQKLGRVIRGYPGKTTAACVEYIDNSPRYLKNHSKARRDIYKLEEEFVLLNANF
jgi:superfamily II DNA or RNA helicase